jgi:hypothetical protein
MCSEPSWDEGLEGMNGLGLEVVEVFKNDHFEIEHNVVHCADWFVAMTSSV